MERFGFIHEELDIKLLILYVLKLLPGRVSFQELSDLVLIDGGFDYFEYSQCLSELVDTGHVVRDEGFYRVTEKGSEHLSAIESSLPYSVRVKADKHARPVVERMQREALIGASHQETPEGGCMLKLSLSDGVGDILRLKILTGSQEQALAMEKAFRGRAEGVYQDIIRLLTPEKE